MKEKNFFFLWKTVWADLDLALELTNLDFLKVDLLITHTVAQQNDQDIIWHQKMINLNTGVPIKASLIPTIKRWSMDLQLPQFLEQQPHTIFKMLCRLLHTKLLFLQIGLLLKCKQMLAQKI